LSRSQEPPTLSPQAAAHCSDQQGPARLASASPCRSQAWLLAAQSPTHSNLSCRHSSYRFPGQSAISARIVHSTRRRAPSKEAYWWHAITRRSHVKPPHLYPIKRYGLHQPPPNEMLRSRGQLAACEAVATGDSRFRQEAVSPGRHHVGGITTRSTWITPRNSSAGTPHHLSLYKCQSLEGNSGIKFPSVDTAAPSQGIRLWNLTKLAPSCYPQPRRIDIQP